MPRTDQIAGSSQVFGRAGRGQLCCARDAPRGFGGRQPDYAPRNQGDYQYAIGGRQFSTAPPGRKDQAAVAPITPQLRDYYATCGCCPPRSVASSQPAPETVAVLEDPSLIERDKIPASRPFQPVISTTPKARDLLDAISRSLPGVARIISAVSAAVERISIGMAQAERHGLLAVFNDQYRARPWQRLSVVRSS